MREIVSAQVRDFLRNISWWTEAKSPPNADTHALRARPARKPLGCICEDGALKGASLKPPGRSPSPL